MDCTLVQGRLSEFSDGCVVDAERRALEAHVARCKACYARLEEYRTLRRSLQALPKQTVPSPVAYYVRSAASREASRRRLYAGFDGWMREKVDSLSLFANNLMRPLAIPAVGGLCSAIILFSMVMTNFRGIVTAQSPNDIPTILSTDASILTTPPMNFDANDIVLDVLVDETGKIIDYSFPEGYGSLKTAEMRRRLENSLLFTQFKPATAFGQPVIGWVRVSFQKKIIDIQG
jgi:hypothetical protein